MVTTQFTNYTSEGIAHIAVKTVILTKAKAVSLLITYNYIGNISPALSPAQKISFTKISVIHSGGIVC